MAQLSMAAVVGLAYDAGLRDPRALAEAAAIATAESGRNPAAVGDVALQDGKWGPSIGLWQVRSLKAEKGKGSTRDADRLTDPKANAAAMMEISKGGKDWSPWTVTRPTNPTGFFKYTAAMPGATSAVAGVLANRGAGAIGDQVAETTEPIRELAGVVSDAAQAPARMIKWLSDGGTWTRIGYFAAGMGLIVGAVIVMSKGPITRTATTVVKTVSPVGKVAKAVKG
jgi:hypothetical protein